MKCPSCNHINRTNATVCERCYLTLAAPTTPLAEPVRAASPVGELAMEDLLKNALVGGAKITASTESMSVTPLLKTTEISNVPEQIVPPGSMRVDSLLQTNLLDNILNPNAPKVEQLSLEDRSVTAYHNRYGRIQELPKPTALREGAIGDLFYMVDEAEQETVYEFPNAARRIGAWFIDNLVMTALSVFIYLSLKLTLLKDVTDTAFSVLNKYITSQIMGNQSPEVTKSAREQLQNTFSQFNTLSMPTLAIMLTFVIVPFLYMFLPVGLSGKTFGYYLLKMRVVNYQTGGHVGIGGAALRALYVALPQLICILALYYYPTAFTAWAALAINLFVYGSKAAGLFARHNRGLHDKLARACVLNAKAEPRLVDHIYEPDRL